MQFDHFLESLGFSERESLIYITLVERGEMHISDVARSTHINRVALYASLPTMISAGTVSVVTKGKQKLYRAEDPEKLEVFFERQKKDFDKNIHKLKKIYSRKKKRPIIAFREGQQGINDTYEDIALTLPRNATFYRYSSRKDYTTNAQMSRLYFKMREQKQLQRFLIVGEEKSKKKKKRLDREMKVIPKKEDLFDDDVSQIIYGDKVAFIDYENKISFVIESKKIATFQRKLFKLLYKEL